MTGFTAAGQRIPGKVGLYNTGERWRLTARLPVDLADALYLVAEAKGCAVNHLVVELLQEALSPEGCEELILRSGAEVEHY